MTFSQMLEERKLELWELCQGFVKEQGIGCAESIYQNDGVILNALEFIEKVCDIVGYVDFEEERREEQEND